MSSPVLARDLPPIRVATTPLGQPVEQGFGRFLMAIQGESGCGKSSALETMLCRAAEGVRDLVQFAVLDGKTLSFMHMTPRMFVYTTSDEWIRVVRAFVNEVKRRYLLMAREGIEDLPITPERPYLLLVCDEMNVLSGETTWETKAKRTEFMRLVEQYSQICRQANMGLVVSGQSLLADTITTATRSNLSSRLALRTSGPEQKAAINMGRDEECDPTILDVGLPGDCFALTDRTASRFVRCRADRIPRQEQVEVMSSLACDKRMPACLDFDNPDFNG
ncbi:MAG: hypothetical protein MR415_02980 [Coriobacteriaceae bacterium]|uniref:FtsK/SpoIIIE domain-containing protein n=1 Tax=Tractidigestivibacter sp. TaxID=2847320 RepID=UPI002A80B4CB|nr:FtsK/SpoIIIE domain-containing protein [Tractidigestivibacter sp.]MCI6274796.1 hypothetical protein [Coriobacteriaceae bacterium]MCI6547594.1 hypothetical protein [Coriobacteriaceae bacterium]MCI7438439.1 hypothetical protein [Coriobacteriaceae bacterium]MDD7583984.1 FtsK/SpoIIIE domain-containing protein [Coriobacteriaceae bacterium]MDY4534587.1 FtsK/SpoIIIE domain-containing protein [Tractidigestivibacter sp.]